MLLSRGTTARRAPITLRGALGVRKLLLTRNFLVSPSKSIIQFVIKNRADEDGNELKAKGKDVRFFGGLKSVPLNFISTREAREG